MVVLCLVGVSRRAARPRTGIRLARWTVTATTGSLSRRTRSSDCCATPRSLLVADLALFEIERPMCNIIPRCAKCGAEGEPIPTPIDDWDEGAKWAFIALAEHDREMHPEVSNG